MNYKRQEWAAPSILQIRVIAKGDKTTIGFHRDHLLNSQIRSEMKANWPRVFKKLEKLFG